MKLPRGFRSGSIAAGLKSSGALDLTVIQNQGPRFEAAAVFTSNKVVAAPVIWSREVAKGEIVRAAVLNSGGANACTGPQGFLDTHVTAELIGELLSVSAAEVIVCSTGMIGELLPMEKITSGIRKIVPNMNTEGLASSAEAIMTTDSIAKIATSKKFGVEISGIAKGAGMLAPSLATMLSVLMTDAVIPKQAQRIFTEVVERTYNRIDSDGCTSTNDTVLLMSSGASGIAVSDSEMEELLMEVCGSLASQLIADAEGSTKSISIVVHHAVSEQDAVEVARACARNNLLKAAIFGGDPNWGRVLAAVGTANAFIDPQSIDVSLNGIWVCKSSSPHLDKSMVDFSDRAVTIEINLNVGDATATVLTNDLSHAYVHENSAYSS